MATDVVTGRAVPESAAASFDGDLLIEQSRELAGSHLRGRDGLASLALAGAFAGTASALALLAHSTRPAHAWTLAVLALLPVQYVPLCVLGGLLLGGLPEYVLGRVPVDRSLLRFVNSWHAVGPALVLVAAGQPAPTPRHLPIYALALLAQVAFDFGSTALRDRLGLGVSPIKLVRFMVWIWAVDLALTPIAVVAALGCQAHPWLITFAFPLIGLLAHFARERQVRIDHALELSTAYRGTALLLGDVVEADDAYTGLHSREVV